MAKKIDLDELEADAVAAAYADADGEVSTVTGYVRSVDKKSVTMTQSRESDVQVAYARNAIVASFEERKSTGLVTLLVRSDARVQVTQTTSAALAMRAPGGGLGHGASCASDDGRETCACLPGQKCVKGATFCKCKDATDDVFPGAGGINVFPAQAGPSAMVDEAAIRDAFGPGELQPDGTVIYKERCYWRTAWICTPRGCRIIWYRECISYPE